MKIKEKPTDNFIESDLTIRTMHHFAFQQNGNVIHEGKIEWLNLMRKICIRF
ncbi:MULTISPECIES: hypothetical protein [unclassified Oceanobacillus]|uniref:hypothetical protein n=1 Tax=unclassified Oceanobacillus TaxID=2630292 RepID=UPI001BE7372C|nr:MULTISPECIES: hypothetical protein [unclassified Oceanobacillus]MBT2599970.1 hypothetical protein [Oceanobacillus sp. ISL-74]